ncbi:major facilitator superfamily domain-containing protein [Dactylonectria estremocensis]|uniref:Major facilitator superfamily domain-containing protein n=1 Tax=Dactylonectria estremocensis TaxID=1079267 RepID=A0A9P9F1A9_9HYPO|nr:major facilitator superfamily domain-containing protein [Dactylonectria estremocensis]
MTSANDNEKSILEQDRNNHEEERPPTADSDSRKSNHSQIEIESLHDGQPVVIPGEPLGNMDTKSVHQSRTQSRASSTRSRAISIVPRSRRRGLLGSITIVPEISNPYDYKRSTKWGLICIIALATAAAPLGSTVVYPALPVLAKEFDTSETITNLSVALYMISMAIFPLWWSSFSEEFGRRSIYLTSFSLFVIFSILSAISTNITMLIVFRMCAGGASASAHSTGAGSVADLFEVFERGRAMSIFYLGPLLGPLIAPVIGGVVTQEFGWQATMWFLSIYGLVVLLMILFFLPETLARRKTEEPAPAVQTEELQRMRTIDSAKEKTKRFTNSLRRYLIDPLGVILYLRYPPVLITVMIAAIAFGSLYVANIAIQQKFSRPPYNYGELIIGLLYIPSGLGYIMASLLGGKWIDNIMAREARKANRYDEKGKLIYFPEDRLRENAWIASTVYPLALLMFGWTLKYGVHFMVPAVALFFFGVASMLIFSAATTMLTEFIRKRSSAGVAINNFVRNTLSCIGAIVAAPWINAIDVGWVFTSICIFCMLASYFGIWILRKNSAKWRVGMDEALNK